MLEATVKSDCQWTVINAFSGRQYIKSEWRRVPEGHEEEATRHPMLDVRLIRAKVAAVVDKLADKPIDATPSAVALAEESGIDLARVDGSGKDGRITKGDVEAVI